MPASPHRFRYSDRFIRVWTIVLCTLIVVLPLSGMIYGATLGSDYEAWQGWLAGGLIIGGVAIPLLIGAVLGGEAIRRGGGIVGVLFTLGLIGGPTGSVLGIIWLTVAGFSALALGVIGFFVIGFAAKVPMWIGSRENPIASWNVKK